MRMLRVVIDRIGTLGIYLTLLITTPVLQIFARMANVKISINCYYMKDE